MKNDEAHIIEGIRAGRESAFEKLFSEYYRPLSVFSLKYVGDLDIAKEIVQNLFVHLYETRQKLIITTSLKSYLYQSARNRCLNHIKQTQARKEHLDLFSYEQEERDDLEARIIETELEHQIFKIVDKLPPQCKLIFTMSRVRGLSNSEIASKLEISKRTVETQISNALKVLRKNLEDLATE